MEGDLFKLLNKLCQLLTKSSTVILHVLVSVLAQALPVHNEAQFTGVEWKGLNHTTQISGQNVEFRQLTKNSMYRASCI